jgi:autoinducer 2 (AI-2) kinase
VPVETESTALGAAVYARLGAGLERDLPSAIERLVRFDRSLEPDAAARVRYDELYARWREINRRSLELSEDGLVAPLWRAAGA